MTDNQSTSQLDGDTLVREYIADRTKAKREQAIRAFLPLVKYIIGRLNLPSDGILKREDLYQYGVIGLLNALDRFQPSFNVTFKTFAYKRIHGEIIDAVRKTGVLNREQLRSVGQINQAREKLRYELGRTPTPQEICTRAGVPENNYYYLQQLMNLSFTISLEERIGDDSEESLTRKDTIADQNQIPPEAQMMHQELKEELKHLIHDLPERERLVLALYFYEELTLMDIGQVLGLSESRVSQILNHTLIELKMQLRQAS